MPPEIPSRCPTASPASRAGLLRGCDLGGCPNPRRLMGAQATPRARVSCCQAGGSEEGGFHCQGSPGDISISTFSLFWSGVAAELPVSLSHASGALVPLGLTSSGEGAFLVSQGCPQGRGTSCRCIAPRRQLLCDSACCPAHREGAAGTGRRRLDCKAGPGFCPAQSCCVTWAGRGGAAFPFSAPQSVWCSTALPAMRLPYMLWGQ